MAAITEPGKFEGEQDWVPMAYDDALMNGWDGSGQYMWSEVDDDAEWYPMIGFHAYGVILYTDNQGFTYGSAYYEVDYHEQLGLIADEAYWEAQAETAFEDSQRRMESRGSY